MHTRSAALKILSDAVKDKSENELEKIRSKLNITNNSKGNQLLKDFNKHINPKK